MTISSTLNRISYNGNGVTSSFAVPFPFFAATDLVVLETVIATGVQTVKTLTTHYTISGTKDSLGHYPNGGTVNAVLIPSSVPSSLVRWTIYRDPSQTQSTDLVENDNLPAEAVEAQFDYVTMLLQRASDLITRSLRQPDGDTANLATLPAVATRLSKYLAFDGSGDPVAVDAATASGTSVTLTGGSSAILLADRFEFTPEDFGAMGDGATDDLTPLTNFINAVKASSRRSGKMLAKTYAISAALPDLTVSGVTILGAGPDFGHTVAPLAVGTVIKKIGAASGTMWTIAPTEGAGNQALTGLTIRGLTFEGNSLTDKCVVIKSVHRSEIDITCREATVTGLELNVATTLGDVADAQYNVIRYHGWQTTSAGISLRLIGTATANWSLNWFELVDIIHNDGLAIIEENGDNNMWGTVRCFCAGGGAAVNSIEWRGGATTNQSARDEHVLQLTATKPAIAKGTGTYTVGAQRIVASLDIGNSTPLITVETGATAFDNMWVQTTPTPTSQGGAFTTVAATLRILRRAIYPCTSVLIQGSVVITTAGTATGYIRVPLPFTVAAASHGATFAVRETNTGVAGAAFVSAGSANLDIVKYDAATFIADSRTILFSGELEITP
jgi:hypothetical protein